MTKQLQKIQFLTSLVLLTWLISCQVEEENIQNYNSVTKRLPYFTSKIDYKKIQENSLLMEKLSYIENINNNAQITASAKTVFIPEYGFYLDTDISKYVESVDGNYHSYAFPIVFVNKQENIGIKNLVLSYNQSKNDYDAYIISYNVSQEEKTLIKNNVYVDLTNKTSILPLPNFNSDEIFKIIVIDLVTGSVSCWMEEIGTSSSTGWDDVVVGYNEVDCNFGGGSDGNEEDEGWDGTFPGDGSTSGDGWNTGGGSGGTFGGSNSDPNDPTEPGTGCRGCSDVATSPIFEDIEEKETPCEQLKNTANKTVYKTDANATPTTEKQVLTETKNEVQPNGSCYNSGDEKGNVVANVGGTNYVIPFFTPAADVGKNEMILVDNDGQLLDLSIFMHTHGTMHYSVPSLDDIHSIYAMIQNGNITNTNNFTFYILSAYGTVYALRIEDKNAFLNWGNQFFQFWEFDNFKRDGNDKFEEAGLLEPDQVENFNTNTYVADSEKGLAKFLKTSGNKGIGFYRNTDDNFNNWSKIEMNNNGQKVETPCP